MLFDCQVSIHYYLHLLLLITPKTMKDIALQHRLHFSAQPVVLQQQQSWTNSKTRHLQGQECRGAPSHCARENTDSIHHSLK